MGFLIPFLSAVIHVMDRNILVLSLDNSVFTLQMNVAEVLSVFICSVPAVTGIANIMLANNICDMEEDLKTADTPFRCILVSKKQYFCLRCFIV